MDHNGLQDATSLACRAMNLGRRVKLTYHPTDTAKDEHRTVEVHTVGVSKKNKLCMRVYQTSGSSVYSEEVGWKMLCFEDADDISLTDEASQAPRPGFNPGDRGMTSILKEISNEPVAAAQAPA